MKILVTIKTIVLAVSLLFLFGCTKKELTIDLSDKACKDLQLTNPKYKWIVDPSPDTNTLTNGEVEIQFNFSGEERCIDVIEFGSEAYDCNNSTLSFTPTQALLKTDNDISISGNTVTLKYKFTVPNAAIGNALNHLIVRFKTKNDLGDRSQQLELRINAIDNRVKANSYKENPNIQTVSDRSTYFTIGLWDHAAEDGDIVSVYLNGEWIIENFMLLNATTAFNIPTNKLIFGTNYLVVFAQNEGDSPPNTASISINGNKVPNFQPGLKTGEAVQIRAN